MSASSLWLRLVATWSAAGALLVLASAPAAGGAAWRPAVAAATGVGVGFALFAALGGRPRPLARPRATTAAVLVVTAGAEEVVWRWFALAELAARSGAAAALAATTVAFALAHGRAAAHHLVTGAAFGALFLLTGSLAAAWSAHAAYNLCVAGGRARAAP